ncbi:FecR family protein [Chitinophaga skermanii]|uniref:FecR family protein n=1 Tax=Chitinophaga skermanii TaxID=331697 RepID=A0A327QYG0_9BACT|nr:FecR family protein [Chitinophaga skermanii]RAJ08453.1 FecR family protein [Chitinophaga skermanii]
MMHEADKLGNNLLDILSAAKLTAFEKLDKLSEEEKQALENWLSQNKEHAGWKSSLDNAQQLAALLQAYAQYKAAAPAALAAFHQQHFIQDKHAAPPRRVSFLQLTWPRYAAAIVLLLMGAWYFWPTNNVQTFKQANNDTIQVMPGQEGAILTLADGSTIQLDAAGNGIIAHQNGTNLTVNHGQLAYEANGNAPAETMYNTLTTPKGRQFKILLPDGTTAWLNAASSIRYPTQFTGDSRKVDITGEVYFEAATIHKGGRLVPFMVNANNKFEITVLGTHFNVNTYSDEPTMHTTLLEGKVAIAMNRPNGKEQIILQPGEQASLTMQGDIVKNRVIKPADVEKIMAWKNGVFDFNDMKIDEVMRQLKRWYDIDVKYESGVPDIEFVGKMTRDIPLNGLLIALEKSNVHFRLEGRTLIVMH